MTLGPLPVYDPEAWEEADHDPMMYVLILRARAELSPWWVEPLHVAYPHGGPPFPTLPLVGGLVP